MELKIPEASGLPAGLANPELHFRLTVSQRAASPQGRPPYPPPTLHILGGSKGSSSRLSRISN